MNCTGLFDHSLDKLETVATNRESITKKCKQCGYEEILKRSARAMLITNNLAMQKIKWSADDNRKELLQPMNGDGSVNDTFTEAYGFNPLDERTKDFTPQVQGGKA